MFASDETSRDVSGDETSRAVSAGVLSESMAITGGAIPANEELEVVFVVSLTHTPFSHTCTTQNDYVLH